MTQYGLKLDPHRTSRPCRSASGSASRSCARCCSIPKLLIMDEPTSVLTPQEVEQLFVVLRQLASEGCSILYISHKLHEIKALCDTRDDPAGRQGWSIPAIPGSRPARSMAEKMIGAGAQGDRQAGRAGASGRRGWWSTACRCRRSGISAPR
jgi:ABC-type uncharacterized transport system ATPase subunit